MEKVLSKADFYKLFFFDLRTKYEVIGPTNKGGATSTYSFTTFDYVDRAIDLEMDYKSNMLSHKRIYFPDNQLLYKYKREGQNVKLKDLREVWEQKRVIIGLRPCDIEAISRLDRVLMGNRFVDLHYQDKRRKSIIIGLTCNEPQRRCFCASLGSGPDIEKGYDLLMTDIGDNYFFRAGTDLGKELVTAGYFRDATTQDSERRDANLKKIEEGLVDKVDVAKVVSVMADKYNDELWDEFSTKCFTCGACNMICPTCHCFTVNDKTSVDGDQGTRVIVWDPCHFARFAQMAGNFNLREEKSSRFKHRIYDKFYYSARRYGTVSCVGCGRCMEFCPSHIDIRDALRRL